LTDDYALALNMSTQLHLVEDEWRDLFPLFDPSKLFNPPTYEKLERIRQRVEKVNTSATLLNPKLAEKVNTSATLLNPKLAEKVNTSATLLDHVLYTIMSKVLRFINPKSSKPHNTTPPVCKP
jgi:hypothetical protein